MISRTHVIHEKSIPIKINNYTSSYMQCTSPKNEYGLKQNLFDPTKSSPPNDFMIKLNQRIAKYYTDKNLDNFDSE